MNDKNHKTELRFGFPLYGLPVIIGDYPFMDFSSRILASMRRHRQPSAEDCRQMLIRLRGDLRWGRGTLAAFLGISEATLRRWETGDRHPCAAARRLIWFADKMLLQARGLVSAMDVIRWDIGEHEEPAYELKVNAEKLERFLETAKSLEG